MTRIATLALATALLLAALLGILSLGPPRPGYRPAGPVVGGLLAWRTHVR